MSARFANESVLVTGAATSVGLVIAQRFAAEGARVHICDVQEGALEQTLTANPGMTGTLASVSSPHAVHAMFADARQSMGSVSVLVNVAGMGGPRALLEEVSSDEWGEIMSVNVTGMFNCIREAVPEMKRIRRGMIVNFSSASTRTGLPMRTPYVVSKFAVEGLTRNLARELGPFNVRINAILPGMIDNERARANMARLAEAENREIEEVEAETLRYVSMRTKITPAEIAAMVLFLATDDARHITGQLLGVDGNSEWEF